MSISASSFRRFRPGPAMVQGTRPLGRPEGAGAANIRRSLRKLHQWMMDFLANKIKDISRDKDRIPWKTLLDIKRGMSSTIYNNMIFGLWNHPIFTPIFSACKWERLCLSHEILRGLRFRTNLNEPLRILNSWFVTIVDYSAWFIGMLVYCLNNS